MAERRTFDLYEQTMDRAVPVASKLLFKADRFFDWATDALPSGAAGFLGGAFSRFHNGSYPLYMALTLAGAVIYILLAASNGGLR
jgi:hypothetical protein